MLNESIRPVHTARASRLFGVKQNHNGALGRHEARGTDRVGVDRMRDPLRDH